MIRIGLGYPLKVEQFAMVYIDGSNLKFDDLPNESMMNFNNCVKLPKAVNKYLSICPVSSNKA